MQIYCHLQINKQRPTYRNEWRCVRHCRLSLNLPARRNGGVNVWICNGVQVRTVDGQRRTTAETNTCDPTLRKRTKVRWSRSPRDVNNIFEVHCVRVGQRLACFSSHELYWWVHRPPIAIPREFQRTIAGQRAPSAPASGPYYFVLYVKGVRVGPVPAGPAV